MTELDQQALVPPTPERTIRAAFDASWWGVDPGTLRVSIAWCGKEQGAATRSFPRAEDGRRLALIQRETSDLVGELLSGDGPAYRWPGIVLVEQPSGQTVNPALMYATGVIQAAIWATLQDRSGGLLIVPPVETIPSATWKKLALGRGDAGSKKRGGKTEIVCWARENGYTGSLEDEADAWGVCTAARRLVAFA